MRDQLENESLDLNIRTAVIVTGIRVAHGGRAKLSERWLGIQLFLLQRRSHPSHLLVPCTSVQNNRFAGGIVQPLTCHSCALPMGHEEGRLDTCRQAGDGVIPLLRQHLCSAEISQPHVAVLLAFKEWLA